MLQANRAARLPRCSGAGGISRLKEKKRRKKNPKTTKKEKSAPRAHSRRGQGLGARRSGHVPGAAPGDLPAGVPHRTAPRRTAPGRAGPGTHRPGCRIPSGGTWCAARLRPRRLSQRRGPGALSGAFIGSRQLHALLPAAGGRGGERGWGARAGAEGDSAGGGESAPL